MPDKWTDNGPGNDPDALPYKLGAWIIPPEDRDPRRYRLANFLPQAEPRTFVAYNPGPVLDQGHTSSCVGHSGRGWRLSVPFPETPGPKDGPPATLDDSIPAIHDYFGSQQFDPWPGGEYPGASPTYEGSSLHGLAAFYQQSNILSGGYAWVETPEDIRNALRAGLGPVMFASLWSNSMFRPDSNGFIKPDPNDIAGGHAYRFFAVDEDDVLYGMNNWGMNWGIVFDKGFTVPGSVFKVKPEDVEVLFSDHDAEGFAPVKVQVTPPPQSYYPDLSRYHYLAKSKWAKAKACVLTDTTKELGHFEAKPST